MQIEHVFIMDKSIAALLKFTFYRLPELAARRYIKKQRGSGSWLNHWKSSSVKEWT